VASPRALRRIPSQEQQHEKTLNRIDRSRAAAAASIRSARSSSGVFPSVNFERVALANETRAPI